MKQITLRMKHITLRLICFVLLITQLPVFNFAQTKPEQMSQLLEQGKPIERELKGGEVHNYTFKAEAGQFAAVVVDQRGIDVVVLLFAPDGKQVAEVDSPNGNQGPEPVSLFAKTMGDYRVEIRSLEKAAAAGRYEIKLTELRAANAQDKTNELATALIAAKSDDKRAALLSKEKELVTAELSDALNRRGMRFFEMGDYPTALAVLQLAQSIAEKIGDKVGMVNSLNNIGIVYQVQGNYGRALELYQKALPMAEAIGDKTLIFYSLNNLGNANYFQGNFAQALEFHRKALVIAEGLGNKKQISAVLNGLGNISKDQASYPQALEYYRKSLAISEELDDKPNIAGTLNNIGLVYSAQGNYEQALEHLLKGLKVREAMGNKILIAFSLNNIGNLHRDYGNYPQALDYFQQSKTLFTALGHKNGVGVLDSNIGTVYVLMGNYSQALEYHQKSLAVMEELRNKPSVAQILTNIANVYQAQNDYTQALIYYQKSLPMLEAVGTKQDVALTLSNIGSLYSQIGDFAQALNYLRKSLALHEASGDKSGIAGALFNIAIVQQNQKEPAKAEENYRKALALYEELGNRASIAATLNNMAVLFDEQGKFAEELEAANRSIILAEQTGARYLLPVAYMSAGKAYRALNQPDKAQQAFEKAINFAESMRLNVAGQEARALFFASVQEIYEPYIDFLMQRHKERPSAGYEIQALQISERIRARSLLEVLGESRTDIRQGVDPQLLERERSLQQKLNARAAQETRLLSLKDTTEEVTALRKEIATLTTEYQDVQIQIRRNSPRYAALTQPEPLKLSEIQQQILDRDTILLEYALGEKRGYLWAVSKDSIKSYELPPRTEIETSARRIYALLSDGKLAIDDKAQAEYKQEAARLSEILLAPVAAQIPNKRIVVVADGALQYLPFGALPSPKTKDQPLIATNEIVSLPSASTLAVLRRETANRTPAAKSIAVFADPVFSISDSRLTVKTNQTKTDEQSKMNLDNSQMTLQRAFNLTGESNEPFSISRLPFTRREAEAILQFAPADSQFKALDFKASRETALSKDLNNYRIVHFATHGLLNSEHPELSGIVLSLVNEQGQAVDGFLRLNEIYNISLSADLVVLSACQTALGKEVKGEGLIGLTRGFMYAGSPRVVASLWKVDDVATAELMKLFYQKMLREKMRPAAALRAAKVEMMKQKRWNAPFYWAAFEIQGEWK